MILVDSTYSESTYAQLLGVSNDNILYPTEQINSTIQDVANEIKMNIKTCRCHSSDIFYSDESYVDLVEKTKSKCVEMEAFGLFANAKKLNKKAATLLTCSDSLVTGEGLSPEERQTSFKNMVTLALESAIKLI